MSNEECLKAIIKRKDKELMITNGKLARAQGKQCYSKNHYFVLGYWEEVSRETDEETNIFMAMRKDFEQIHGD